VNYPFKKQKVKKKYIKKITIAT